MSDLRTAIFASVAKAQAKYEPAVGDALLVGTRQAYVTATGPAAVSLHYDDGFEETTTVDALRGRALATLLLRRPGDPSPTFIDVAWALAKSTAIPSDMRATQLAKMQGRAPSVEDAAAVRAWSVALASGKVPVRA